VKLTTQLHLVSRLRMRGATPTFPQYVFMAWYLVQYRDKFNFSSPISTSVKKKVTKSPPVELENSTKMIQSQSLNVILNQFHPLPTLTTCFLKITRRTCILVTTLTELPRLFQIFRPIFCMHFSPFVLRAPPISSPLFGSL